MPAGKKSTIKVYIHAIKNIRKLHKKLLFSKKIKFFQLFFKNLLHFQKSCAIISKSSKRPLSQTAKTSPSHGEDMGSIPVGVTTFPISKPFGLAFFMQDSVSRLVCSRLAAAHTLRAV